MFSDQRLKSESHLLTNDASKGWTNSTTWEGSNIKSQFGILNVANVGPAEPAVSALVCVLTRELFLAKGYVAFPTLFISCQAKSNEFGFIESFSHRPLEFQRALPHKDRPPPLSDKPLSTWPSSPANYIIDV